MNQNRIGYQNPKLYNDIEKVLFQLLKMHKRINKIYRITILEKEVYPRLINAMQNTLHIGINKKRLTFEEICDLTDKIVNDFYIVKTFLSFLVLHNYLDKKFYFIISNEFEQINMQLHGWKKYLKGIKNEN